MRAREPAPLPAIAKPAVFGQKTLPSRDIFHAADSATAGAGTLRFAREQPRSPARSGRNGVFGACSRLAIVSKTKKTQFRGSASCRHTFSAWFPGSASRKKRKRRGSTARTGVQNDKARGFDSRQDALNDKARGFDGAQDVLRDEARDFDGAQRRASRKGGASTAIDVAGLRGFRA